MGIPLVEWDVLLLLTLQGYLMIILLPIIVVLFIIVGIWITRKLQK
jgi:uncharacterized protein YneF (UPF0154 family)